MDPVLSAVLASWNWRLEIVVILVLAGTFYALGWYRIQNGRLATGWRLATYWAGLTLVAIALMSPIDVLGGQLFYMHMI